jgi:ribonuclease HIII
MPLVVGIDEAGYGPNLGPLVQAAVAVRCPDHTANLWKTLRKGVRRAGDDDDGRLLIDDSKRVKALANGLEHLEHTVHSVFRCGQPLGRLLESAGCGPGHAELTNEGWYHCDEPLPVINVTDEIKAHPRFVKSIESNGIEFCAMRVAVTPTPRFNTLVEKWDSKGTVLADGLISLLGAIDQACPDDQPVHFVVDKHGGRNFYAPIIQTAFPNGWITPLVESAEESNYRIDGLHRPVTLVFSPRADSDALPVALASMLAKYLREVFMRQFNKFWQQHVPDLEPTAGYPNDSKRFYGLIQRAMRQLGIRENQVWRER